MSLDIFKNMAAPNSYNFKGLEWQEGHLKALIETPFGELYFDRSELLAQPFRFIPAYQKDALDNIESVIVPLFEQTFMQGKHILNATILSKDLFEFQFSDWKGKIHPDGKHFQITRHEASNVYAYCTSKGHITRQTNIGPPLSGGIKQTLRKNITTLGFLCRTNKLAQAIFWQSGKSDKIIVQGAERIAASRSHLSAVFGMGTEAASPYVFGKFIRPRPKRPPPEFA